MLSADHKPTNPEEMRRIERSGGRVLNGRVNGDLSVSRSLGDFNQKTNRKLSFAEQAVSCEPDITVHTCKGHEQFLVIACDGIWDCVSNTMLGQMVSDKINKND
mmetsp:Transcript_61037/g.132247  ORF Transcript_61037/g.132247 Transcript_61037/m.132247 type:complete len:104 (-) Transcript_61037:241-552(-)